MWFKRGIPLGIEESYKLLGLKKGCSKNEVLKTAAKLQKKIHPDISPETSRLSSIVNEAKDIVLNDIT